MFLQQSSNLNCFLLNDFIFLSIPYFVSKRYLDLISESADLKKSLKPKRMTYVIPEQIRAAIRIGFVVSTKLAILKWNMTKMSFCLGILVWVQNKLPYRKMGERYLTASFFKTGAITTPEPNHFGLGVLVLTQWSHRSRLLPLAPFICRQWLHQFKSTTQIVILISCLPRLKKIIKNNLVSVVTGLHRI